MMFRIFFIAAVVCCSVKSYGQLYLKIKVIDKKTQTAIPGASVSFRSVEGGRISDSSGVVELKAVEGKFRLLVSHIGYITRDMEVIIPHPDEMMVVELERYHEEEDEIVIQSTRSTRTIKDIPTRVEFVAGEELDEKANMKPGDIRMVLNESTGITTQVTSPVSANAAIRIQGLDGRYTQILRDGFPLYGGFSGGLGLLQTPPLDLMQFEVIKGSSSTLYGGGAIAGLVNLISRTPKEEGQLNFHADLTSAGGINTSGFFSERTKQTGITLFASRNSSAPYDPSGEGLTAIPKFERYTVNPKFYWYSKREDELYFGINATTEKRTGGDIQFIRKEKPAGYAEQNNSDRVSTQISFIKRMKDYNEFKVKNSISYFKRSLDQTDGYFFEGDQLATFTELTYSHHGRRSEWITGLNLVTDHFDELPAASAIPERDYRQLTTGLFVQHNYTWSDRLSIESGLRGDAVKDYGIVMLPRISVLYRFSPELTSRVGGGLGYKQPAIFTEESERLQYRDVLPIGKEKNKLERSYGVNADINYRARFADGRISFSFNHLFFYTRIEGPLLLLQQPSLFYEFVNVKGHFDSKGMETNLKLSVSDFKLFLGYTYTKAYLHERGIKTENFLTPRHRLNSVLLYEQEEKWKLGLEAYYFSTQQLSDGATGKSYWITGFMVEKIWRKISLYINFENFTDTRQSRFDTFFVGTIDNPRFRDVYAPLDGFVTNGGVKLRL